MYENNLDIALAECYTYNRMGGLNETIMSDIAEEFDLTIEELKEAFYSEKQDIDPHRAVIDEQIKYAKLWFQVCDEQENNDYDWELTKKKLLSDWTITDLTVDYWTDYMHAMFVEFALEHYLIDRELTKNEE